VIPFGHVIESHYSSPAHRVTSTLSKRISYSVPTKYSSAQGGLFEIKEALSVFLKCTGTPPIQLFRAVSSIY
jgi:hypothetical protein